MRLISSFRFTFLLLCLLSCHDAAPAAKQCPEPLVTLPARESTHSTVRPTISWEAVPGISSYRLRLTSREPEGRTFTTIDTVVSGTLFVPPQALTDGFAVVKVAITSQCPEGAPPVQPPVAEHRFFLDARPACSVGGLTIDAQTKRIEWTPTAGASRYDVYAYHTVDGRLLLKLDTREPHLVLAPATEPAVIAVRARRGEIVGRLSNWTVSTFPPAFRRPCVAHPSLGHGDDIWRLFS
jgi:hypothetical protein